MDRAQAATTLLLWQVQGEQDLVNATTKNGSRPLVAVVEAVDRTHPRPRHVPPPRLPPLDFLKLDEEREVEALRARLRSLAPALQPAELRDLEHRLAPDVQPSNRLAAVRALLDRFETRRMHRDIGREFEAHVFRVKPPGLSALLLFSRDGRLLLSEGEVEGLDVGGLGALVARREPGSTWTLAYRTGVLVGHLGSRAALVAVFAGRPRPQVAGALRVSIASLEQREQFLRSPSAPTSHAALAAYLRAVRMLLVREN